MKEKKWKHCKTNIIYQSTSHNEAYVECISPRCSICVYVVCVSVWVFVCCDQEVCLSAERLLIHCIPVGET